MSEEFSGITGSVTVDDVENSFGSWQLTYKIALVDRRSFMSRGMPRRADGQKDWTLELEGPWTVASSPLVGGQEYEFVCAVDDDNAITVTGRVGQMVPSQDMNDGPKLKVTCEASDDFTPTLIQLT